MLVTAKNRIGTVQKRQYFSKKTKSRFTWAAVIVGGVALWKGLDYLTEYWDKSEIPDEKEKVVVLGTGFAALSFLKTLDSEKFDITVVSPRSYFLYTPLLCDGAVGSVAIESIVEPIRSFEKRTGTQFEYLEAKCVDVNTQKNTITCESVLSHGGKTTHELPYDKLIVAVGSQNNTHGVKGIENANFLNSLNDARRIRNRLVDSLEEANFPGCSEERKKQLLHFVVVGGGPVARKTAAQISLFLDEASESYNNLAPFFKVTMFNSNDHIHNYYDHLITSYVTKDLKRTGGDLPIDELENCNITELNRTSLTYTDSDGKKENLPYSVCVWATGIAPHPLVTKISSKIPKDQSNKIALLVDPELRVLGTENIFALGECASLTQNTMVAKWEHIFKNADLNSDGLLDINEIKTLCQKWGKKYPALIEIRKKAEEFFAEADLNNDGNLTMEEFQIFLSSVDSHLTRYPSTASVSVQEGSYLANCLNKDVFEDKDRKKLPTETFRYKHIGGYEYIGAENGLRERGSQGSAIMTGFGAYWLWNNVFYSTIVSVPMRVKIMSSWV